MKHDWEPVDSQGYAMECARCGVYISIESSDWDKEIDAIAINQLSEEIGQGCICMKI